MALKIHELPVSGCIHAKSGGALLRVVGKDTEENDWFKSSFRSLPTSMGYGSMKFHDSVQLVHYAWEGKREADSETRKICSQI